MPYSLRIYQDENATSAYSTIPSSSIIALDIDPNRASNDDPFEIVGRTATVSIIREEPYISLLNNLITWEIQIDTESINYSTVRDYFRHLVQIVNEQTGVPIFTGIIKRDFLKYSVKSDTLDITVCDSLYFWISLSRVSVYRSTFDDQSFSAPQGIEELFETPFRFISQTSPNCPLLNLTYGSNTYPGNRQSINVNLPFGDPPAVTEGYVILGALGLDSTNASDWGLMSENAAIFDTGSGINPNIVVSYFRLYKNRFANLFKCYYYKSVLTYDDGYFPNSGNNGLINATSINSLETQLVTNFVMPNTFQRLQSTGSILLWNGLGGFSIPLAGQTVTSYINALDYDTGSSVIRLNEPEYMLTEMDYLLRPVRFRVPDIKTKKISDIIKGVCALYSLALTSSKIGGISVVNHLIGGTIATPTEISGDNLIDIKAKAVLPNSDNYKNAFSVFSYSGFLGNTQSKQIADFLEQVEIDYEITLDASIYNTINWSAFMPLTVFGKTMYLYKWQEPTLDDIFTINCYGRWS